MNTSGTHWEQDENMIIENLHPSWLYIQSSHWLHAYSILRHLPPFYFASTNTPSTKYTIPIVTYFLGLVWFGFVFFLSFYLFIYFYYFVGGIAWAFAP